MLLLFPILFILLLILTEPVLLRIEKEEDWVFTVNFVFFALRFSAASQDKEADSERPSFYILRRLLPYLRYGSIRVDRLTVTLVGENPAAVALQAGGIHAAFSLAVGLLCTHCKELRVEQQLPTIRYAAHGKRALALDLRVRGQLFHWLALWIRYLLIKQTKEKQADGRK